MIFQETDLGLSWPGFDLQNKGKVRLIVYYQPIEWSPTSVKYRGGRIADVERMKTTMTSENLFSAKMDRSTPKWQRCWAMVDWRPNASTERSDWHTYEGRCARRYVSLPGLPTRWPHVGCAAGLDQSRRHSPSVSPRFPRWQGWCYRQIYCRWST